MPPGTTPPSESGPPARGPSPLPPLREIGEMLGLVRGVLADGVVTDEEARSLSAFLRARPGVASGWPGDVVALRLERIFEDGRVDSEEREDLARLLAMILEADRERGEEEGPPLPLDDPPPVIRFMDRLFVFAGPLALGSRGSCHRMVVKLGGRYGTTVTEATDYLVVGGFHESDWTRSSSGEEIRRALELREQGAPVAIVGEEEFSRALPRDVASGPRPRV